MGASAGADVLLMALRGSNLLQNLLGEQALSAAFVPIYSRFLKEGREQEARRFAGACGGLLLVASGAIGLIGVVAAPLVVTVLAPGWRDDPERFGLLVDAVRITFPMAAILVLSAWCLAILNSHRRFFLPYFAPVLWNLAIILALLVAARWVSEGAISARTLVLAGSTGALVGGMLQFGVQLPRTLRLLGSLRLSLSVQAPGVRQGLLAFWPVFTSRGVVQLASYADQMMLTFFSIGAIASGAWAGRVYLLAVALFGTAYAVGELPELSRLDLKQQSALFHGRLTATLRKVAFFVAPTMIGFFAFGFLIVGVLFRTGRFGLEANWLVYWILCGYTFGLLPVAISRVLQSCFFALRDTRTPARIAVVRLVIGGVVGFTLLFLLDSYRVVDLVDIGTDGSLRLGALGLALGSSVAGWYEWVALTKRLAEKLPSWTPWAELAQFGGLSLGAALPAGILWWLLQDSHVLLVGPAVLGVFAVGYLSSALVLRVPEAVELWRELRTRLRPGR